MRKLIDMQERQTQLLEEMLQQQREGIKPKTWLTPEEAAEILGLQVTPSRSHRPRLAWLVRQGFITKYRKGNPPAYDRNDIEQLADKIRNGKVYVPSHFPKGTR